MEFDVIGPGFGEFVTDQETIFERLSRGQDPKTSAVIDHGTPGQWHGAKATTAVACQNDQEVLEGLVKNVESHDLVIARFMDLSHTLGCEFNFSLYLHPVSVVINSRSFELHRVSSIFRT